MFLACPGSLKIDTITNSYFGNPAGSCANQAAIQQGTCDSSSFANNVGSCENEEICSLDLDTTNVACTSGTLDYYTAIVTYTCSH